jgi:hypothetical protein
MSEPPFLEHPTGEYETAVAAMEEAVRRLRELPEWKKWITFCAQGAGTSENSTRCAEIRLLQDVLDAGGPLDIARTLVLAKVGAHCLVPVEKHYSIAAATPREAAQVLDTLFRFHLGIRPFAGEGDDYPIGVEW